MKIRKGKGVVKPPAPYMVGDPENGWRMDPELFRRSERARERRAIRSYKIGRVAIWCQIASVPISIVALVAALIR